MNLEPLSPTGGRMAKAKKRRAKKRKAVNRAERVAATPETLAKLKPWPMQDLLRLGPENNGISSGQFEAALKIVEAFKIITHGIGFKPLDLARVGHGSGELGAGACRLWNIYIEWGNAFQRRAQLAPHTIVEMVEDDRPIGAGAVWLVALAADMWDRAAGDYDKEQRAERNAKGGAQRTEDDFNPDAPRLTQSRDGLYLPLRRS